MSRERRQQSPTVVVGMLGRLHVDIAGAGLGPRDFDGVKPKQLLELLLLERGHPVSKDRLADLLWGERLPRRVEATIERACRVAMTTHFALGDRDEALRAHDRCRAALADELGTTRRRASASALRNGARIQSSSAQNTASPWTVRRAGPSGDDRSPR